MAPKTYQNFDLWIEKEAGAYRAHVLRSPVGEGSSNFALSTADLQTLVHTFGQTRGATRDFEADAPAATGSLQTIGNQLFSAIFAGQVGERLSSSLAVVQRENAGLRIRLRLSQAPELIDVPWEYLWRPESRFPITLSVDTPLVRYLELGSSTRPLGVKPPLRILVAIASPAGYPPLDVEKEWQRLQAALREPISRQQVVLERLDTPSLDELQKRLRKGDFHIFHFIGHGDFNEAAQEGVLLLETEDGKASPAGGSALGPLFLNADTLRLAVLNACEGARTSDRDPFAGVAQSLVEQGIPAVVAMQFPITDEAAITLAEQFYGALADNYPVDAALAEARKAIYVRNNEVEWGTPVLYMRSDDGQIFDLAGQPAGQMLDIHQPALAAPPPPPPPPPPTKTVNGYRVVSADILQGRVVAAEPALADAKAAAQAILHWAGRWNKNTPATPEMLDELAGKLALIYAPFIVASGSLATNVTFELSRVMPFKDLPLGQRKPCTLCNGAGVLPATGNKCTRCQGRGYDGAPVYSVINETRPVTATLKDAVTSNHSEAGLTLATTGPVRGTERSRAYGDDVLVLLPGITTAEGLTRDAAARLQASLDDAQDKLKTSIEEDSDAAKVRIAEHSAPVVEGPSAFSWLLPVYVGTVGALSLQVDGQTGAVSSAASKRAAAAPAGVRAPEAAATPLETYLGAAAAKEQANVRRWAVLTPLIMLALMAACVLIFIVLSRQ